MRTTRLAVAVVVAVTAGTAAAVGITVPAAGAVRAAQAAAGIPRGSSGAAVWDLPTPPSGLRTSMDQDVRVLRKAGHHYWANQFGFSDGVHDHGTAYLGLQTIEDHDAFLWSVWDAIEQEAPADHRVNPDGTDTCGQSPGEGDHFGCWVNLKDRIEVTHTYRYHVGAELENGSPRREQAEWRNSEDPSAPPVLRWGTWWHAELRDVTDGTVFDLGASWWVTRGTPGTRRWASAGRRSTSPSTGTPTASPSRARASR